MAARRVKRTRKDRRAWFVAGSPGQGDTARGGCRPALGSSTQETARQVRSSRPALGAPLVSGIPSALAPGGPIVGGLKGRRNPAQGETLGSRPIALPRRPVRPKDVPPVFQTGMGPRAVNPGFHPGLGSRDPSGRQNRVAHPPSGRQNRVAHPRHSSAPTSLEAYDKLNRSRRGCGSTRHAVALVMPQLGDFVERVRNSSGVQASNECPIRQTDRGQRAIGPRARTRPAAALT